MTGEAYSPRPALHREEGGGLPQGHRHRRHRVLRARSRVLHLRLRALRPEPVLGLLLPRLDRGRVELRRATELDGSPNLGYKIRVQGGLLPRAADGPVPGPPLRDDAHARAGRHRGRGAAPRGRHRGPGRDRHALRHAGDDGRQAHALQVRDQERRAPARASRVTFMPKPLFQDNGSGMHVHQSLWKGGEPLFFDEKGYAGLSDLARWYIGGLLTHAPSLLAFTNPTTNSYKRLVPGYEAPVNLVYSQRNRSGGGAHPAVLEEPEGEAARVPLPRPVVQPVPRVLGDADGRPRRHPEPHRAAHAARPRPLRPPARGAGEGAAGAGLARTRCSTRSRPTTSSCSRAACSRPT